MKKLFLLKLMLVLLAAPIFFTSCGDDDEQGPTVLLPKLDGFYVYGTNTIAADPSEPKARMALAVLDNGKEPKIESKAGVYGKFMYIGANSTIQFAEVKSAVGKIYGAENGGAVDKGEDIGNVPLTDNVIHGTLTENSDAIKITEEGLYYVFANTLNGFFDITKVTGNLIGDATLGDWATATFLSQKSASKDSTVFEKTNVVLKGAAGYRWRLASGWHFYFEEGQVITLSSLGVPDYDAAWSTGINDLGLLLPNIPNKESGVFTVKLKYTAATDKWTESKVKTGEAPADYANFSVGIIGNATADGTFAGNGTGGYELKKPTKAGDVFTWTWTGVTLIKDGEFVFLQDATWGKFLVDASGATHAGAALTDKDIIDATTAPVNGEFHNFYVINGGTYNVSLSVNGTNGAKTVTITK